MRIKPERLGANTIFLKDLFEKQIQTRILTTTVKIIFNTNFHTCILKIVTLCSELTAILTHCHTPMSHYIPTLRRHYHTVSLSHSKLSHYILTLQQYYHTPHCQTNPIPNTYPNTNLILTLV